MKIKAAGIHYHIGDYDKRIEECHKGMWMDMDDWDGGTLTCYGELSLEDVRHIIDELVERYDRNNKDWTDTYKYAIEKLTSKMKIRTEP